MRWRRGLERFFWITGVLLVAGYVVIRIHGDFVARRDIRRFEERLAKHLAPSPTASVPVPLEITPTLPGEAPADTTLWSPGRIRDYEAVLKERTSEPLALLRIPKIGLEVPVLAGTDALTLNRAVGWIPGTSRPGDRGNTGIAGHRDGFFRGLKDVARGDSIELVTLSGSRTYRVERIWIVNPEDVQVLDPTPQATLTLVSCYPFRFVGAAPKRYIVRALSGASEVVRPPTQN